MVLAGKFLAPSWAAAVQQSSRLDVGSIVQQVVAGGVGGGVLMAIVGAIRQAMGGNTANR